MDDESLALFAAEMGDVKPIGKQDKVTLSDPSSHDQVSYAQRRLAAEGKLVQIEAPLSDAEVPEVAPDDELSYMRPGVQLGVFRKLRLGQYHFDAVLDLHGFRVEEARLQLTRFIQHCCRLEIRTAQVIHGLGRRGAPQAKLKSCVNYWLPQLHEVMAFHTCQAQHGGRGAVYVLLRKGPAKKLADKERHQRRIG